MQTRSRPLARTHTLSLSRLSRSTDWNPQSQSQQQYTMPSPVVPLASPGTGECFFFVCVVGVCMTVICGHVHSTGVTHTHTHTHTNVRALPTLLTYMCPHVHTCTAGDISVEALLKEFGGETGPAAACERTTMQQQLDILRLRKLQEVRLGTVCRLLCWDRE